MIKDNKITEYREFKNYFVELKRFYLLKSPFGDFFYSEQYRQYLIIQNDQTDYKIIFIHLPEIAIRTI